MNAISAIKTIKRCAIRLLPQDLRNALRIQLDKRRLGAIPRKTCRAAPLRRGFYGKPEGGFPVQRLQDQGKTHRATAVDIGDVNDEEAQPWRAYGSRYSPMEMLAKMGVVDLVTFVVQPSLEYFSICNQRYDFIFLYGDHAGKTVYQELPAALRLLDEGGIVLLHDYFPGRRLLWPDGVVIPAP